MKSPKNYKDLKTIKFGEHLIFDAYGCNPEKLNNMELCYDVLNRLTKIAGMRKIGEPYLVKADSNEALGAKDPGGYSGFLIIQESHISIHTFVKRKFVTIDVYSCKPFKTAEIIRYLKETFETEDADILKMDRGLKYPKDNLI